MVHPSEYKDRFETAMRVAGKDVHAMAAILGVSYQAVMKVIAGTTKRLKSDNNSVAALALGVDPDWLATGAGEMVRRSPPDPGPGISARALQVAQLFDQLSPDDQRSIERRFARDRKA